MCFGVNIEILTQSDYYQEFFLKHTAGPFLMLIYQHISQLVFIYSVFKNKHNIPWMRWIYDAEDELIVHKMEQLWRSGIIIEIEIFGYISIRSLLFINTTSLCQILCKSPCHWLSSAIYKSTVWKKLMLAVLPVHYLSSGLIYNTKNILFSKINSLYDQYDIDAGWVMTFLLYKYTVLFSVVLAGI